MTSLVTIILCLKHYLNLYKIVLTKLGRTYSLAYAMQHK